MRNIVKSLLLLTATVVICAIAYPLAVWAIGQTFFASRPTAAWSRDRMASRLDRC